LSVRQEEGTNYRRRQRRIPPGFSRA
jgi:hypothetical protein